MRRKNCMANQVWHWILTEVTGWRVICAYTSSVSGSAYETPKIILFSQKKMIEQKTIKWGTAAYYM
jgi:hypothetical protein